MTVRHDYTVQTGTPAQAASGARSALAAGANMIDQGFGVLLQQWVDQAIHSAQQMVQPATSSTHDVPAAPLPTPLQPADLPGFESTVQKFSLR